MVPSSTQRRHADTGSRAIARALRKIRARSQRQALLASTRLPRGRDRAGLVRRPLASASAPRRRLGPLHADAYGTSSRGKRPAARPIAIRLEYPITPIRAVKAAATTAGQHHLPHERAQLRSDHGAAANLRGAVRETVSWGLDPEQIVTPDIVKRVVKHDEETRPQADGARGAEFGGAYVNLGIGCHDGGDFLPKGARSSCTARTAIIGSAQAAPRGRRGHDERRKSRPLLKRRAYFQLTDSSRDPPPPRLRDPRRFQVRWRATSPTGTPAREAIPGGGAKDLASARRRDGEMEPPDQTGESKIVSACSYRDRRRCVDSIYTALQ